MNMNESTDRTDEKNYVIVAKHKTIFYVMLKA